MRKTWPVVLALAVLTAGCGSDYTPPAPDTSGAHPLGYGLAQGAVHHVTDGSRASLDVPVGDLITVTYWGAPPPTRPPALRLAALSGTTATYQAVAPGQETLTTGPVGHPCLESGRSGCGPDATPPPTLLVTVAAKG